MKHNLKIIKTNYELVVRYLTSKNFIVRGKYIHDLGESIKGFEASQIIIAKNPKKWLEEHIGDYNALPVEDILLLYINEEILGDC